MKGLYGALFPALFCLLPAAAGELEAGVAIVDITPPIPYRMSGYFRERLSTGAHDPLHAKAIVLRQDNVSAALVFCDLIGMAREVSSAAREQAAAKTGIPAAHILIAATHSHTGPLYFGSLRAHWHALAVQKQGVDPCETEDYPAALAEKLAAAIMAAHADLRPVTLAAGKAHQIGLSFNRRFHMKGGGPVRFNPGKMNPDILRPAGPIDPEVGIILARDPASQSPRFSLSVFALHLDTVGGTEYSADFPGYLEETLRKALGEGFVSVFGQGTCGDINHVDVSHKRPQKGHEEAQRIGTTLGGTIVSALDALRIIEESSLAVRSATVDVPLQEYTPEDLAHAREVMAKAEKTGVPFLEHVAANKILKLDLRDAATLPLEVQAFRLSKDVALVGLPGEIFVGLGLAIKRASPFPSTFVVELANDAPAYIPTRKAFREGSYETVNSIIASGGGEMLVDAAVRLLQELGTCGDDTTGEEPAQDRGRVSGIVLNAVTREPIEGAYVRVDHSGDAGGANLGRFQEEGIYVTAETGSDGRFVLDNLAFRDDHPFIATCPGYIRHEETITLRKEEPEIDMEVALRPGGAIRVRVVDDNGEPLREEICLRLEAEDKRIFVPIRDDWPRFSHRLERTRDGSYTFGELDAGIFRVEAIRIKPNEAVYYGDIRAIAIGAAETRSIQISPTTHKAAAEITVAGDPFQLRDTPSYSHTVLVVSRDPALLLWQMGNFYHPEDARLGRILSQALLFTVIPASGGPYRVLNLPPGDYAAFVWTAGHYKGAAGTPSAFVRGVPMTISAGQEAAVDIHWTEPVGPSGGPYWLLDRCVTFDSAQYTVKDLCQILTARTAPRLRIKAAPAIQDLLVAVESREMCIWEILEALYADKGWGVREEEDGSLVVGPGHPGRDRSSSPS